MRAFAPASSPPSSATLIAACALSIMTLNLILPSLGAMAAEFEADYALVSLALGGYAAATAPFLLLFGPLSDRYGRRPVLLAALAAFIVASLVCALAGDVWTFLAGRLGQAAVIAGIVIATASVRDVSDEAGAARRLSEIASVWALAPMLAPLLGGLVDEAFGWRANHWLLGGLGVALFARVYLDFGETNLTPQPSMAAQFRGYPELARSRRFWGYSLCGAFSVGAFYAFLGGAPIVAAERYGLGPAEIGVVIGAITAGFFVGSNAARRIQRGRTPAETIIVGRLAAVCGLSVGLTALSLGADTAIVAFGPAVFVGFGNGVTIPNTNAGAMSVRPRLAGAASGFVGALTVGGGALLSSAAAAVVAATASPAALLAVMLTSAMIALAAALYVRWIDRREGPTAPAAAQ